MLFGISKIQGPGYPRGPKYTYYDLGILDSYTLVDSKACIGGTAACPLVRAVGF